MPTHKGYQAPAINLSANVVNAAALAVSLLGLLLNAVLVLVYGFGGEMVLFNVCTNFAAVCTELKHVICSIFYQKEKKTGNEAVQNLTRLREVTSPKILDKYRSTIAVEQETNYMSKFLEDSKKSLVDLRKEVDDRIQEKKQQKYSQKEVPVVSSAIIIDVFCTSASIGSLSVSNLFAGTAYNTKKANIIAAANAATICTKIFRLAASYLEEREKALEWKAALLQLQLERLEEIRGRVDELSVAVGLAMDLLEIRCEMTEAKTADIEQRMDNLFMQVAEAKVAEIKQRMENLLMQVHEHIDLEMAELNLEANGPNTESSTVFSEDAHEYIREPEIDV